MFYGDDPDLWDIEIPEFNFPENIDREFRRVLPADLQHAIERAALAAFRGDLATAERFRKRGGYNKISDNDQGG